MARSPRIAAVECPFTGERLAAVQALRPDVAVVHAQQADHRGSRHRNTFLAWMHREVLA